jgi:hypothetical protein
MRSIILFLFIASCMASAAQAYRPLLDPLNTWQETFRLYFSPPGGGTFECYKYYLQGDTVVNDTTYHLLRKTGYFNGGNTLSVFWYSGSLAALVREDTVSRRVYLREPDAEQEVLMYDFSVGLGPYPWTYPLRDELMQVTAVDYVDLPDGPHRRITLDGYIQIIEGIGALTGFVGTQSQANYVAGPCGLVCQMVDELVTIEGTASVSCACGTNVGITSPLAQNLQLFPSPTTGKAQLTGAPARSAIHLLSADGRIVLRFMADDQGGATIDLSGMEAGMYLVTLVDTNTPFVAKLLKE